ncbi:MAG TPA: ferredoxin [Acidimicrobiia bacterium]|nr:ferredoxin [Acidimicrobiia bacterium]
MTTRITVTDDCAGTGQCVAVAPDLFELDADGLSTVVAQPDTPERLEAARKAAGLCPMAAIRLDL